MPEAYGLTTYSAPASEPVTLTQAKAHCRVDSVDDDPLISALIVAAREYAEVFLGRALITQTLDLTLNGFAPIIELPRPPLQSVTSITYTDSNGTAQALSSTYYTVDTKREPGRVFEAYGYNWPTTQAVINAVTIRYVAGYGEATSVPQRIKQAILLAVGHWYENRESTISGTIIAPLPMGVNDLLWSARVLEA